MTIGIYKLNFNDGSFYIGQSINIEKRYTDHCYDLSKGKHYLKLQNKYNELTELPLLEILLECDLKELDQNEDECIEIWDATNKGLNTLEKANELPKGHKTGSSFSFKTYTKEQILNVFYYLVHETSLGFIEIEKLTGVKVGTIRHISGGRSHLWLKEEFVEEYKVLDKLRHTRQSSRTKGIEYPMLESPEGVLFSVQNVNEFAREHNLQAGNLHRVLKQERKSHKGWTLAKEETC